jgi:ABC-type phosphate transport system substrate-binding protein
MAPNRAACLALVFSIALVAQRQRPVAQVPVPPALAVIVHRSNPIEGMTFRDLRRIFMLETQTWPHGRKITVVLRDKGQPERDDAIRIICGLSEDDYEKHILLRTFQGRVNIGPRSIQSASAMVRFVYSAPGAIGYVAADEVEASVKLLRIDDSVPGDPRYPLVRGKRGRGEILK